MNKIAELKENFCWKSKTKSVWQENPDLLDRVIARIHSEATVYDAIIRSKNRNIPTNEKIFKTVKFLEENSFWRSNPFSLIVSSENDPDFMRTTSRLQKKCIRDLWDSEDVCRKKLTIPPISTENSKCLSKSDSETSVKTDKINIVSSPAMKSESSSVEIQTSPRKFAIVSAKSIGIKGFTRNSVLNDFNYDSGNNFSRTYAEAVRGSTQGSINSQTSKSIKSAVWD